MINTRLTQELTSYRGNPAEPIRTLSDTLLFFHWGTDPGAIATHGVTGWTRGINPVSHDKVLERVDMPDPE